MSATDRQEKARADLQERLAVLFEVMFWSLVALVIFVAAQYSVYPDYAPAKPAVVYIGAAVGLAAMAVIWRAVLVSERKLSLASLHRLDFIYSLGIGISFAASAYLQRDLRPSGYMSVIYTAFTVFARALLVPSSARRTLSTSLLTFFPMMIAALAVTLKTKQELSPSAFFFGFQLLSFVAIVLATAGSSVIYGLRSQVVAAHLGQYKLEGVISKGGMGTVYRARHTLLRRETAIKLVQVANNETLEHFEQEVQAMSELTHPNTVVVYDYGRSLDGQFYYAMEYLPGVDLHNLVKRYGALPSGRVARLLAQVCGALHEAHGRGLIHRDIKPANIIACERGGVPDIAKVIDFGLVKDVGKTTNTTQTIKGTAGFIAPEVVTDPELVGPASDLYAVGCVAYYLVTGRNVFVAPTPMEQLRQHVKTPPRPPSQLVPAIAPELEAIILRCLEKRPADRYANARELAAALRAVPTHDWTDATARTWWSERRTADAHEAALSANPTRTITVDIGHRT